MISSPLICFYTLPYASPKAWIMFLASSNVIKVHPDCKMNVRMLKSCFMIQLKKERMF